MQLPQGQRVTKLNAIAIHQMRTLAANQYQPPHQGLRRKSE